MISGGLGQKREFFHRRHWCEADARLSGNPGQAALWDVVDSSASTLTRNSADSEKPPAPTIGVAASIEPKAIINCPTIADIPPGRQTAKILKCGIAGCTSTKLFDRKWELERHVKSHEGRKFPCLVAECSRRVDKAFARADKRNEHMRKVHGV